MKELLERESGADLQWCGRGARHLLGNLCYVLIIFNLYASYRDKSAFHSIFEFAVLVF